MLDFNVELKEMGILESNVNKLYLNNNRESITEIMKLHEESIKSIQETLREATEPIRDSVESLYKKMKPLVESINSTQEEILNSLKFNQEIILESMKALSDSLEKNKVDFQFVFTDVKMVIADEISNSNIKISQEEQIEFWEVMEESELISDPNETTFNRFIEMCKEKVIANYEVILQLFIFISSIVIACTIQNFELLHMIIMKNYETLEEKRKDKNI